MAKKKAFKSDIKAAIHEMATGLYEAGLMDRAAMQRFDHSCLKPVPEFSAEEIRALREREKVSQSEFSEHLNVSKDSVSQWERGQAKPMGAAMKLLSLVQRKGLDALRES